MVEVVVNAELDVRFKYQGILIKGKLSWGRPV
jgi:hypothetical protein